MIDDKTKKILEEIRLPEIEWKMASKNAAKNKAMIVFYIDSMVVQDRLNEAFGMDGWSFRIEELTTDKALKGILLIGEDKVIEDIGVSTPVDTDGQPKYGWSKNAASDALKRCGLRIGIGKFLRKMPQVWIDVKPDTKYLSEADNARIASQLQIWYKNMVREVSTKEEDNSKIIEEAFEVTEGAKKLAILKEIDNATLEGHLVDIFNKYKEEFNDAAWFKKALSSKRVALKEQDGGKSN